MYAHHATPSTMCRRPTWQAVLWLVVALLWAQCLGLAHRTLHSPHPGAASVAVHLDHGHAPGLWAHLLSSDGDADCRLYDQLGQADALPALPGLPLALPAPVAMVAAVVARLGLPAPASFEARGPPFAR